MTGRWALARAGLYLAMVAVGGLGVWLGVGWWRWPVTYAIGTAVGSVASALAEEAAGRWRERRDHPAE